MVPSNVFFLGLSLFAPLCNAGIGLFHFEFIRKRIPYLSCITALLSMGAAFVLGYLKINQALSLPAQLHFFSWGWIDSRAFNFGAYLDELSLIMMIVVTSISTVVHLYSLFYMGDDPGKPRFFSYLGLFVFSMLLLILSGNMLQLFFGWEGVGCASYLLIGFWFQKEAAIKANFKAFLVNRIADVAFLLGMLALATYFGTLEFNAIFSKLAGFEAEAVEILGHSFPLLELIAFALFIGAMGKSAQFPLHIWLPDSMEGPTPVSALIHAATMVTAGIFMIIRCAPLFECCPNAQSFMVLIGATGALALGLVGTVQKDIKKVIAYSTLSQLGYMVVALGISAYGIALFHLVTHAFFKALLFLGAGILIFGLHHEQDLLKMGGLRKYFPITFLCMWGASLSLMGFPFSSGFYSKELILEAVHLTSLAKTHSWIFWYAEKALLLGVCVTAWYSTRLLFLAFHRKALLQQEYLPYESKGMKICLLALLPAAVCGGPFFAPFIFSCTQNFMEKQSYLNKILLFNHHDVLQFGVHGAFSWPVLGMLSSMIVCWIWFKKISTYSHQKKKILQLLYSGFYLDNIFQYVFVGFVKRLSLCASWIEEWVIEKGMITSLVGVVKFISHRCSSVHFAQLSGKVLFFVFGWFLFLSWIFYDYSCMKREEITCVNHSVF